MTKETLEEKIARVVAEHVEVVEYDPHWPQLFAEEKAHIQKLLPEDLLLRIEHFGSTAVEDLPAKPIVDMVIEITDVDRGKTLIPELLEPLGYDCFWRPLGNKNVPPYYTWCIKRDANGERTHHLHFVEKGFKDHALVFRDILRNHPDVAAEYARLKRELATETGGDRIAYTQAKGEFIQKVLEEYSEGID